MDGAGLIDASLFLAIAGVIVTLLYSSCRSADVPARARRATHVVLAAVALVVHAGLPILSADRDIRNLALRLDQTKTELLQMEEIIQDYEKQNHEMMSNLASILSRNPENIKSMSYNRSRSPDGTENTELTVTMKDADVHQPLTENGDTGEIMEEFETVRDEAAPFAGTPPPSQGEAMGAQKQKPLRGFLVPFLYSAGAGRYALFMSPPGDERIVPTMSATAEMNQKLVAADLRGDLGSLIEQETEVVPESLTLSPDVAAFWYRTKHGMTALIIVETDGVKHVELPEEVAARAVAAVSPPGILFTISFPDLASV